MRIGIIGRHQNLLTTALDLASKHGYDSVGATTDGEALTWIHDRAIDALIIGGGVEADSRLTLTQAALERDIRPIAVRGPHNLTHVLATLDSTTK